ncbi:MAG TPA: histidine kinase, partial [Verrucomicrobiae bacterium]
MSMLKKISFACLFVLVVMATCAWSAERGSKDEAKAVVEKCVKYIKENGKEKAFTEINNPKGMFVDKDIYIFAYDFQG